MEKKNLLIMLFAGLLLSSCNDIGLRGDEETLYPGPHPLVIDAGIAGKAATRAIINKKDSADEWSYVDFEGGDYMGFFSSGGKFTGDNYGQEPFENQKLIYVGGTGEDNFRDPNGVEFSPSHMNGNEVFMYFPYSDKIDSEYGVTLRTDYRPDGQQVDTVRCIDFLSTEHLDVLSNGVNSSAALYGEFNHTFAELIIMRGDGFDNPPDMDGVNKWQIKAVLNTPVTGIKVEVKNDNGWSCKPVLVHDPAAMDASKAKEWYAWQGANFYMTQEDKEGQTAWYVIVPTIGCQAKEGPKRPGDRTSVEYVELYDNDGNLQRVSSLLLSNANSKYVDGGWRYPMEITLKELVPTANPCQIIPWNGDYDLTDERKRGINNESEFDGWVNDYNAYILNPTPENSDALFKYGDLYRSPNGEEYWHFYVLKDLNLASYQSSESIVPVLKDIIDGQSTVFTNGRFQRYSITGLSTTFFGTMQGENAKVQNFRFVNPNVNGGTNTSPRGIIANNMVSGALVENCQISGGTLYNPEGPGGMVAGSVSGATIKDCTLSGFLITSRSHDDIVGEVNGEYISEGNNVNNVTKQNIDD